MQAARRIPSERARSLARSEFGNEARASRMFARHGSKKKAARDLRPRGFFPRPRRRTKRRSTPPPSSQARRATPRSKRSSVHHLGPRRHEVFRELLLQVGARRRLPQAPAAASASRRSGRRGSPVHLTSPVFRSRPSYTPSAPATGCHCVPMSSRLTKKSFVSVSRRLGEDAVRGPSRVRAENAQAADENRHLGRRQRQQLRPIHEQLLGLTGAACRADSCGTRRRSARAARRSRRRFAPATRPCAPA